MQKCCDHSQGNFMKRQKSVQFAWKFLLNNFTNSCKNCANLHIFFTFFSWICAIYWFAQFLHKFCTSFARLHIFCICTIAKNRFVKFHGFVQKIINRNPLYFFMCKKCEICMKFSFPSFWIPSILGAFKWFQLKFKDCQKACWVIWFFSCWQPNGRC